MNKTIESITDSGKQISSRSKIWQIWFPLVIGIIIICLLGLLFFSKDKDNTLVWQIWVNISIILLSFPLFLVGISFIIVISVMIFLLSQANENINHWLKKVQPIVIKLTTIITRIAIAIPKPFLLIESIWSGVVSVLKKYRKKILE
jgi:hypothetical protein